MTLQGFFNKGVHFIIRKKYLSCNTFFLHSLWQPNQSRIISVCSNAKRFFSSTCGKPYIRWTHFFYFPSSNQVSERTSFELLKNALRRAEDIGQTSKQGRLNSRHGRTLQRRSQKTHFLHYFTVPCPFVQPSPIFPLCPAPLMGLCSFFYQSPALPTMQNGLLERRNYIALSNLIPGVRIIEDEVIHTWSSDFVF